MQPARLERPASADVEAPGFGQFGVARTGEVGIELRRAREVVVSADGVFEPRVGGILGVGAVAAGDGNIAVKLVEDGRADISRALVVRALDAGTNAEAADEGRRGVDRRVGGDADVLFSVVNVLPST